jgi:transcriptional regulator with XRE-family HTH domain
MDDIELIKFGQKIKFERIKRNWSQEQLAEFSNISLHGISNIETGKTDVKYSNILRLARAFAIRACELLDFKL